MPIKGKHHTSNPHAPYNTLTRTSSHDNFDTVFSPNTHIYNKRTAAPFWSRAVQRARRYNLAAVLTEVLALCALRVRVGYVSEGEGRCHIRMRSDVVFWQEVLFLFLQ